MSKLGANTARDVLALFDRHKAGALSRREFIDSAALLILRANAQGVALAELSLSALLEAVGAPLPMPDELVDAGHWLEEDRLMQAVAASLSIDEQAETRLERLARSEPVEATQRAFGRSMDRSEAVEGWTRDLEGGACQLCTWWWREGEIWPTSHTMPTHKGCECSQRPIVASHHLSVSREAAEASADRAQFGDLEARRLVDPSRYSPRALGRKAKEEK